jgi:hypothetical protein
VTEVSGVTEITHEEIARRAYEIAQSDDAGTDEENWRRAERELRGSGGEADAIAD